MSQHEHTIPPVPPPLRLSEDGLSILTDPPAHPIPPPPPPPPSVDPLPTSPQRASVGGQGPLLPITRPTQPPMMHRLTIMETIFYQGPHGSPICVELREGRRLHSDEYAFLRPMEIGQEWVCLDMGWVTEPSLVIVRNWMVPGEGLREVEVGVLPCGITAYQSVKPFARVRQNDSLRISPVPHIQYHLRSIKDPAQITVYVFPR